MVKEGENKTTEAESSMTLYESVLACRLTRTNIIPERCQRLSSPPLPHFPHLTTRILMLKVPTVSPRGHPQSLVSESHRLGPKIKGLRFTFLWFPCKKNSEDITNKKKNYICIPGSRQVFSFILLRKIYRFLLEM